VPTVTRTSGTGKVSAAFGVTVTFSEPVTGFTLAGVSVTNGTASSFVTVNTSTYTVSVTPTTSGNVVISVPAAAAADLAGNSSTLSNTLTVVADLVPPTVTVSRTSGSGNVSGLFNVTITFSKPVVGFVIADIGVTNGAASNFVQVDSVNYTADITPAAAGNVTISVAAGVVTDQAGNPNLVSNTLTILNVPTADVNVKGEIINIYPNPSTGQFKVELGTVNNQIVKIIDINGRVVYSGFATHSVTEFSLGSTAKGIYMLEIIDGNTVTMKKIIIQ
jgi:Bacterial Ig-like domain/Secretion system C-terminal sorting domain